MNLGQLELWLSRLLKDQGPQLFRYKGVLAVKGFDAKWIFQVRQTRGMAGEGGKECAYLQMAALY